MFTATCDINKEPPMDLFSLSPVGKGFTLIENTLTVYI